MEKKQFSDHLRSTYELISRAFPDGWEQEEYFPLLVILQDHLSDRNLAQVISMFADKEYPLVMNEIGK